MQQRRPAMSTRGPLPRPRGKPSCTMSLRMAGNLSHMCNRDSHHFIQECRCPRTSNDCRRSPCTPSSPELRLPHPQGHLTSTLRNYQRVHQGLARQDSSLPDSAIMSRSHRPIKRCRDCGFKVWVTFQVHQRSPTRCSRKPNDLDPAVHLSVWRYRFPWRRGPVHEHRWAVRQRHPADASARK